MQLKAFYQQERRLWAVRDKLQFDEGGLWQVMNINELFIANKGKEGQYFTASFEKKTI